MVLALFLRKNEEDVLQVAATATGTLVDVCTGVVVLIDMTVVVGIGSDRRLHADDMSEHANGTGAPAQLRRSGGAVVVAA
jgi:hypothetical protein